jgi:tetrahydromethanopterin S-methyltransferase subunit A
MQMTNEHIDAVLAEAQELLWGGSETENIAAHNLISNLIKDRMTLKDLN